MFGRVSPSGKLPVTFPKAVGQTPIYYNHKNTGRPPSPNRVVLIDDIEVGTAQTSLGMTALHLDVGYEPLFPFGFGLTYTSIDYDDIELSTSTLKPNDQLTVSATVKNTGDMPADEIVQLYTRDLVGSVTRPVKELKNFQRVHLLPDEQKRVTFDLSADDLAFYRRDQSFGTESGAFHVWIGGDSTTNLRAEFRLE